MSCHNDRHGKKGLGDRIRDAKTTGEAQAIFGEGAKYASPSAKTVRRWERLAAAKK